MRDNIKFEISAPGRIVLSGEYGAMYGKQVVSASLNLRTELKFSEQLDSTKTINIKFVNVGLSLEIPLEVIVNFCSTTHFRTLMLDHIQFRKCLQSFITVNDMWKTPKQRSSLEMFFFLLMHIVDDEDLVIEPFLVDVSTQLILGLGSSSSFAVCLSACFLNWARRQKGVCQAFEKEDLIRISNYAKLAEKVILNKMFESDIDVCCYGNVIKSRYNIEKDEYSFEKIDAPMIRVLVIYLKIKSQIGSRMRQIAKINYNLHANISRTISFLSKSDEISIRMCEVLENINVFHKNGSYSDKKKEYLKLLDVIQAYLQFLILLNLTSEELKYMGLLAQSLGYAGTIAGYGNNVAYILLPLDISEEQITDFQILLRVRGFGVKMGSISCKGLTIVNK